MNGKTVSLIVMSICVIAMIAIFIFALDENSSEAIARTEIAAYEDNGQGLMTILKPTPEKLHRGFQQWKQDYPGRARRIISHDVAVFYHYYYFSLLYETE